MIDANSEMLSIFADAIERPLAERNAFLDIACAANADLRRQIDALLRSHDEAGNFLRDRPGSLDPAATTSFSSNEAPSTVIGPYKLVEPIGEGGMGKVWMAQQSEPVKRLVALKLIKAGMDSRQVIARFEAERQALALMDHPNIARVLDGGTTEAGRPYFVMDLVKGVPITRYCDEHHLTPRQRLELFVPVCQAIQHAHQKGIIHRDLKPSNVLVAQYDGRPVPKIIDFGVAKAAGQSLTDKTLVTGFGNIVGTLEYMSPEQAEVNQLDIDTRCDIYSLGVILYELLTGSPPFSRKELEKAGMLEMLRVIREKEPSKPSTKLSTAEGLPTLAANRGTEPTKLTKLLRGELDWIVMKALEKDRNRRYETANGFALDVQRYLADEPVQACPPSTGYRLKKLARRNKWAITVAGLFLLLLVSLAGGSAWIVRDRAARRDEAERDRINRENRLTAQIELILNNIYQLENEHKWSEAREVAARAEMLLANGEAAESIHLRVAQVIRDLTLIHRLDAIRQDHVTMINGKLNNHGADQEYGQAFRDYGVDVDRLLEAAIFPPLRSTMNLPVAEALDDWIEVKRGIGDDGSKIMSLIKASGALDPDPIRNRLRDTWIRPISPELKADLTGLAGVIDIKSQGPATINLLAASLVRAGLPEAATTIVLQGQRKYPNDFWLNFVLGYLLMNSQRDTDAIRYLSVAVALRPRSASSRINLGLALRADKRNQEAIQEFQTAIEIDPKYFKPHINLGHAFRDVKKIDLAKEQFRIAIELNPNHAQAYVGLGNVYYDQKHLDEAVSAYRKAIELEPNDVYAHSNLGTALREKRQLEAAIKEFLKAIELNPGVPTPHYNLGLALRDQNQLDESIKQFQKAIELDAKDAAFHINLANVYQLKRQFNEAIREYRIALSLDPKDVSAHYNFGIALRELKQSGAAIVEFRSAIHLNPKYALAHNALGAELASKKQMDEAIKEFRVVIELDHGNALAHYFLGSVLLTTNQLDEAIKELETAVDLAPTFPRAHYDLGTALRKVGRPDAAIKALRKAIQLRSDYAEAHFHLGQSLADIGSYQEALVELRLSHTLGSRLTTWRYPSADLVREIESCVRLEPKLDEILKDKKDALANSDELLHLAMMCQRPFKKLYVTSAHLFARAFDKDTKLANDLKQLNRYNAACAAALAGTGQGNDAKHLDESERIQLRKQGMNWLWADLKQYQGKILGDNSDELITIERQLANWLVDSNLENVRGQEQLAKFQQTEREQWSKLWAEVNETLKQIRSKVPSIKAGTK